MNASKSLVLILVETCAGQGGLFRGEARGRPETFEGCLDSIARVGLYDSISVDYVQYYVLYMNHEPLCIMNI